MFGKIKGSFIEKRGPVLRTAQRLLECVPGEGKKPVVDYHAVEKVPVSPNWLLNISKKIN